jgi:conjugal transfer mating pair stabilization protein TraN
MIRIKNGDPATKNINGLAVHRDAWDREIVLECGIDSECGSLQRAGGVLVKKECVSADGEGRCLVWEKSYDFGKKPSYVAVKRKFKEGEKIWGLNGEFDDYKQNYDKRSDFPQMAAALSSLVGMYRPDQEISEESLNNPDLPQLYPGEARSCHCNLQSASPFDCCEKTSTDVRCSAKELETAGERDSGRCHWIGMRRDAEGNTEQIYCCFGSKIARIIQEQAHQKLSIGWGSTEDPLCRGLTQKEYGKLASGKIDLSEAYDDYPASGDEMAKSLQEKIRAHLERNSP